MAKRAKLHFYWVHLQDKDRGRVVRLLKENYEEGIDLSFDQGGHSFLAKEARWHKKGAAFTISVFKLRDEELPSSVDSIGNVELLDLDDDSCLGEPIVLAYYPGLGVAAVPFSSVGPRHTVLRQILWEIGLQEAIELEPVLRLDSLERLQHASILRKVQIKLGDTGGLKTVRGQHSSVDQALNLLGDSHGVSISIQISMGHQKGSLAQSLKGALLDLANSGSDSVKQLKLSASQGEGSAVEVLDLLKARLVRRIRLDFTDRVLDRKRCRTRVLARFEEVRSEIVSQQDDDPQSE